MLDFNEARDYKMAVASAGPYANHLVAVLRSGNALVSINEVNLR